MVSERFNQTLQNMLAQFVSTKKEMWSSYLDTCVFAYNTSRHESTKYCPFELMFGRKDVRLYLTYCSGSYHNALHASGQ